MTSGGWKLDYPLDTRVISEHPPLLNILNILNTTQYLLNKGKHYFRHFTK